MLVSDILKLSPSGATLRFCKIFQPCNVTNQSSCNCSMPKFKEHPSEKPMPRKRCDPDLVHNPYVDYTETTIIEVGKQMLVTFDQQKMYGR